MLENLSYQDYEKDCDTLLRLCKLSILSTEEYESLWNKITQYYIKQRLETVQAAKVMSLVT